MRCIHDDEFRKHAISTEQEMLAMTDAAILNALNIYAGCTRKRWEKMESGEIWGRRKYFIDSMEYMLKQGDFSTFRAA